MPTPKSDNSPETNEAVKPPSPWFQARLREEIGSILHTVIWCIFLLGFVIIWPTVFIHVSDFVEKQGLPLYPLVPIISVLVLASPLVSVWLWQVSFRCPQCQQRFNYRLTPFPPKFALDRRCVSCGLRRPRIVVRRVTVEVEE